MFKGMTTTTDKPTVDKVEEVSLIMALGRLEGMVSSYGPPGPDDIPAEVFAGVIANLVFKMEDNYRDSFDLVKLKKELWYVRSLAKSYQRYIREFTLGIAKGVEVPGFHFISGANMAGNYTCLGNDYAGDIVWGWRVRSSSGVFARRGKDLHQGFEKVDVSKDMLLLEAAPLEL
jgi:hypothetical protein